MRTKYLANFPWLVEDMTLQVILSLVESFFVHQVLGQTDRLTLVFLAALAVAFIIVIDVSLLLIIALYNTKLTHDHFYTELVWLAGAFLLTLAMIWHEIIGIPPLFWMVVALVLLWTIHKLWSTEMAMIGVAPHPPTQGRVTFILWTSSFVYVLATMTASQNVLNAHSIYPWTILTVLWYAVGITVAIGRKRRKAFSPYPSRPIVESDH